jgi:rare lipoprotein A
MIAATVIAVLAACSSSKNFSSNDETRNLSPRVVRVGDPVPKGGGVFKIGNPYVADGKWYYPASNERYDETGIASWYGDFFHGRKTANGEVYDMNRLSAAHPTLPMPTYARVTSLRNNRSIIVRVNDRGPYKSGRIIDLSRRAAELLGFHNHGTGPVRVQYLGIAPMDGDDSVERRSAQPYNWAANVERSPAQLQPGGSQAGTSLLASAAGRAVPPAAVKTEPPHPQLAEKTAKHDAPAPKAGFQQPSYAASMMIGFGGQK